MAHQGSRRKVIEKGDLFVHPEINKDYVYRDVLEEEVIKQARTNRGIELPGNANQLLVGSLFRDQSKPWEGLAKDHLIRAWESARYFVLLVLQYLTDDHTYSLLIGSVIEPELEKLRQALLDKLTELTAYTKRGHPLPVGNRFLTQIQKARSKRQIQSLKAKLNPSNKHDGESVFTMNDIEQATLALESSRDEFAAADIIDQMQAYYETAILTFIDNVAIVGIENCLLDPLQRIFTSQVINDMEDDQIRELAAEPSYICEERDRLTRELAKLQAGLRTLSIFNTQKPSLDGPPSMSLDF
ncbi:dynamin GTPase [Aspergillus sclerotialis]|uniref:Dynamin GTPase n=1 Tax=Aspergillus sclerotialis TaxID=2070753 RepID=A0A3A2ZQ53_9EURO|nr:dynamin GTPase [Aspergillus sclerotialis]